VNPVATVLELAMAEHLDDAHAMTAVLRDLDAVDARMALTTAVGMLNQLVAHLHDTGVSCGPCWYEHVGLHAATYDEGLRRIAAQYRAEVGQ